MKITNNVNITLANNSAGKNENAILEDKYNIATNKK